MIKRIAAMGLALVMALGLAGAAALAEDDVAEEFVEAIEDDMDWGPTYAELNPGVEVFDGIWVSGDGLTRIEAALRLDRFEVLIIRKTGDHAFTSWEYLPEYDAAAGTLVAGNGLMSTNIWTDEEDGLITDSKYLYEDGTAVFAIGADGKLTWQENKEDAGAGMAFTKIGWFADEYVCDRARIQITYNTTTDRYAARIWWSGSVSETQYWSLDADCDPATGSLVASGETMLLTYLPDGTVDPSADQHVRETTAVFSLNEENNLIWSAPDGIADGMVFEKTWKPLWVQMQ